jgi:hypothetical protein
LNIYAPTGAYNAGELSNVGLNYWTFEPMVSFSTISKKTGLEITATAGLDFNTENNDTDYHSGDVFHIDATIAEHLPLCAWGIFGLGVNGYYWKQFNPDTGSGARLGSFETLMTGVGPVVSYISPPFCGGHMVTAEVKWLPQIDTRYTLNGNYVQVWFLFFRIVGTGRGFDCVRAGEYAQSCLSDRDRRSRAAFGPIQCA